VTYLTTSVLIPLSPEIGILFFPEDTFLGGNTMKMSKIKLCNNYKRYIPNGNAFHRLLSGAFNRIDGARTEGRNFLYREDGGVVVVQSAEQPNWQKAFRNNEFLLDGIKIQDMDYVFNQGDELEFKLKACPAKKRTLRDGESCRKKTILLNNEQDIRKWMDNQGCLRMPDGRLINRFSIVEMDVKICGQLTMEKFCESGMYKISSRPVILSGILRVENAEEFRKAWMGGIGDQKAYGFGLLLLA
jgi:CRISPR-associated protein Cas6/Cse3/CasE subtype I-E